MISGKGFSVSWIVVCLVLGLCLAPGPARAQEPETRSNEEFDEFREALRKARPAKPHAQIARADEPDDPNRYTRTSVDLRTGEITTIPNDPIDVSGPLTRAGRDPLPEWRLAGDPFTSSWATETPIDGDDSMGRDSRACTTPPRSLATHDFPWSTTYKILSRYNSGGTNYYFSCSASSFSSFHLLTAGHCIYTHDPNEDGDTSDAQWAQEVWVWAAQTDVVNPFGDPDHPFSFAKATVLDTYDPAWVVHQDLNYDIGYIALDRKVGDSTGWMWREANVSVSTLNFNGYPVETPYVPEDEIAQYPHYNTNNVVSYSTNRIHMCAYTYGGHSGGPVWRRDPVSDIRYVQGVNSTSTREGDAWATRITTEVLGHMDGRIIKDTAEVPPVARPDLTEYVWSYADDTKDVYPNSVTQGGTFFVKYSLINAGFANSGLITVDFYLSSNQLISSNDVKVGTAYLGAIDGGWYYIVPDMPLVANISPGTYWVGWIFRSAVAEYGGDFTCTNDPCGNVVIVADETVTVTPATSYNLFSDGFESGNTASWSSRVP